MVLLQNNNNNKWQNIALSTSLHLRYCFSFELTVRPVRRKGRSYISTSRFPSTANVFRMFLFFFTAVRKQQKQNWRLNQNRGETGAEGMCDYHWRRRRWEERLHRGFQSDVIMQNLQAFFGPVFSGFLTSKQANIRTTSFLITLLLAAKRKKKALLAQTISIWLFNQFIRLIPANNNSDHLHCNSNTSPLFLEACGQVSLIERTYMHVNYWSPFNH